MTAIPAVPSEPPLTGEAALSDAELVEIAQIRLEQSQRANKLESRSLPWAIRFYLEDMPRVLASLRSAREELRSARAERVELIAERDQARPDREAAKARLHPVLHELDVRITDLPGDCHCNLVAEVILDALYGREGQTEEGASRGE